MRSDTNLNKRFAAEGVDTRDYGSMPGVIDTSQEVDGQRVLRSHSFSGSESNSVFYNRGGQGFDDISAVTGIDSIADGRAFAFFDYDLDGRSDLILTNSNDPQLQLFRNQVPDAGNSVSVRLVGGQRGSAKGGGWSNRDAYGAHVIVQTVGGKTLRRELRCGDGFAAQNSRTLTIGIGREDTVEKISVEWPSGKRSELGPADAGQVATIFENPDEGVSAWSLREGFEIRQEITATAPLARIDLPVRGKLNLITTMATWCPTCRAELPHLSRLAEATGDKFQFYALPIDPEDGEEKLAKYEQEMRPPYEILPITGAQRQPVEALMEREFGDLPLPCTLLVDSQGRVLKVQKGVPTLSELRLF